MNVLGGIGVEISPPHWDGDVPWLGRGRVPGEVPCSLHTGFFTSEVGVKRGGGYLNRTGRAPFINGKVLLSTITLGQF